MIDVTNLYKKFNIKGKRFIDVFENLNFTFSSNGFYILTGKSGSGKTTFLNLLYGLEKPDSGSIDVKFHNNAYRNQINENQFEGNVFSYIFQDYLLFDDLNVYENIEIALNNRKIKSEENNNTINDVLSLVHMSNFKYSVVSELSGGQKQRVAIARALINNPSVILADEPTGNLDTEQAHKILHILKEISKEKLVIMVTHDWRLVENYADYILKLEKLTINQLKNDKKTEEKQVNEATHNLYPTNQSKGITNDNKQVKTIIKSKYDLLRSSSYKNTFRIVLLLGFLISISISIIYSVSRPNESHIFLSKNNYLLERTYDSSLVVNIRISELDSYPNMRVYIGHSAASFSVNLPNSRSIVIQDTSIYPLDLLSESELTMGRLPDKSGEIIIDDSYLSSQNYNKIVFSLIGDSEAKHLLNERVQINGENYIITGIVSLGFEAIYMNYSEMLLSQGLDFIPIEKFNLNKIILLSGNLPENSPIIISNNQVKIITTDQNQTLGSIINTNYIGAYECIIVGIVQIEDITDDIYLLNEDDYANILSLNHRGKIYGIFENNKPIDDLLNSYHLRKISLYENKIMNESVFSEQDKLFLSSAAIFLVTTSLSVYFLLMKSYSQLRKKTLGTYRVLGYERKTIITRFFKINMLLVSIYMLLGYFIGSFIVYNLENSFLYTVFPFYINYSSLILGIILVYMHAIVGIIPVSMIVMKPIIKLIR